MDGRKRWKLRMLGALQVLAAAVIAGTVIWLLYRYVQYGERFAREAGADPRGNAADDLPGSEADKTLRLPDMVRVQILSEDFAGEYHGNVHLTCEKAFVVKTDGKRAEKTMDYRVSASELAVGQVVEIAQKKDIPITLESLKRADGYPQYTGTLRLYRETDGIVLVNELPLEEYLCGVVSSEMPSDYPEEAQKAQAVCARTYACSCIRNAREETVREAVPGDAGGDAAAASGGDPLADLDDSVNDQVYNNYRATAQSRQAVEDTAGEILPLDGIQYYSTSCQSEHREDLDSDAAFRKFLAQEPDAGAEYDSPWLRWEAEIPAEDILEQLSVWYGWQEERIDAIRVTKREGNGQVTGLEVIGGSSAKTVSGEYEIRRLLSPAQAALRLRDGEEHSGMRLLPSAFFWLESVGRQGSDGEIDRVVIHGGGYGHGVGMSQYGAAAMAERGLDYREILKYYYQCELSG